MGKGLQNPLQQGIGPAADKASRRGPCGMNLGDKIWLLETGSRCSNVDWNPSLLAENKVG